MKAKLTNHKGVTFELTRLETKYVRALKEAEKAWNQNQSTKTEQNKNSTEGGEYSIVKDSKNRDIVMLDRNIFDETTDLDKRGEALEDWIINNFGGQKYNTKDYLFILVNERTAGKMKFWNENMDEAAYKIKLSAAEHIDELIKISKHDRHGPNIKKKHKEFAKHGWDYFKSYFTDGERVYEADMSAAKTDNGSVLYNIGYIKDIGNFIEQKESSYSLTGSPNELVTILDYEASNKNSNDRIAQNEPSVNSNSTQESEEYSENREYSLPEGVESVGGNDNFDSFMSMFKSKSEKSVGSSNVKTDSEGTQLSKGQSEYFKDSKVVDENGNLKAMYHGSPNADFYIFDPSFSDDGISLFFTDRVDVAESYSGTVGTYEALTFKERQGTVPCLFVG